MKFFVTLWHKVRQGAIITAHVTVPATLYGLQVASMVSPEAAQISAAITSLLNKKGENESMNPLEAMAVTMVLGMLQQVVKNPVHAAALKMQLVAVANDIYTVYGMVPPLSSPGGAVAVAPTA